MRLIRTIIAAWRFARVYWSRGADATVVVVDEPDEVEQPKRHFEWHVPDNARVSIDGDENWGVREHDTRCQIWGAGDWMDRSR